MKMEKFKMAQIEADLALNVQFIKGQKTAVRNCWHISTDGNAVESMFFCEEDFIDGMNRIYLVSRKYHIIILAFILMDTHIHFVLYGRDPECKAFISEYLRQTSQYLSNKYQEKQKLKNIPVNCQAIADSSYLKQAICYDIENAPRGGLKYNYCDYPWGSGPLYFRKAGLWSSPSWMSGIKTVLLSDRSFSKVMKTNARTEGEVRMIGDLVFPGEYVEYELVERIFRTHKSFNFFLGNSRETEIEEKEGVYSALSIPIQQMRQYRNDICLELFGKIYSRSFSTAERIKLAKALKNNYNSSTKQIARLCGLVYNEVGNLI